MNVPFRLKVLLTVCLAVVTGAAGAAELKVEKPWARATAGRSENGAAYMILIGGDKGDTLLRASSPVAETVELHTHLEEDGVMRMRPVPAIDISHNEKVELKPGGLHIMLMGLKGPLKEGRHFPLTLTFERAGNVETDVPILAPGARGG